MRVARCLVFVAWCESRVAFFYLLRVLCCLVCVIVCLFCFFCGWFCRVLFVACRCWLFGVCYVLFDASCLVLGVFFFVFFFLFVRLPFVGCWRLVVA